MSGMYKTIHGVSFLNAYIKVSFTAFVFMLLELLIYSSIIIGDKFVGFSWI